MTTTHHEHGPDEHGRDGDRGRDGGDHEGDDSAPAPRRGRRPTRIDVVAGLALLGLVAALDLSLPAAIAASGLAAVTGALVRVDVAERRLPNVLVLVVLIGAAAGVVLAGAGGEGTQAAWACLLGLVVFAACVPLVHAGGLGAGDAKLASVGVVVAELVSPSAPLAWLVAVALLGGVHGVAAVLTRRHGTPPRRVAIPFGPVMLVSWWLAVVAASTVLDAA
ncbi:prepilin peptidase [Frigoribacterium sp. PvP032]|uniref:prepilin peptidase n=1 Tax=Frigoribacterium sp. PvP032 TaxID=2806589 RepID=UPI001AE87701|nr:prepilin peptidase [Frigoribacterium sp. PvP032]MBP1191480.1 Flp pilus assembly protein protease CpaA [Frigoribacterium sp. PvP032]